MRRILFAPDDRQSAPAHFKLAEAIVLLTHHHGLKRRRASSGYSSFRFYRLGHRRGFAWPPRRRNVRARCLRCAGSAPKAGSSCGGRAVEYRGKYVPRDAYDFGGLIATAASASQPRLQSRRQQGRGEGEIEGRHELAKSIAQRITIFLSARIIIIIVCNLEVSNKCRRPRDRRRRRCKRHFSNNGVRENVAAASLVERIARRRVLRRHQLGWQSRRKYRAKLALLRVFARRGGLPHREEAQTHQGRRARRDIAHSGEALARANVGHSWLLLHVAATPGGIGEK